MYETRKLDNHSVKIMLLIALLPTVLLFLGSQTKEQTLQVGVLRAQRIEVTLDGEVVATIKGFKSADGRRGLSITSPQNRLMLTIVLTDYGGVVTVYDKQQTPIAGVGASPEGGSIVIKNKKGEIVGAFFTTKREGLLRINNSQGRRIIELRSNPADYQGGDIVVCYNGGEVAHLGAFRKGGIISIFDVLGRKIFSVP